MKTKLGRLTIGASALLVIVSAYLPVELDAAQPKPGDAVEQASDADLRVDLVIELTPQRIALLKKYRAVRINVPRHLFGRVDSILFQQSGSELDRPVTAPIETQLIGRAIVANIDSSLLQYVAYRPVKMMVYYSDYRSVLIRLNPGNQLFRNQFDENSLPTDSPLVWVNLKNGRRVEGKLRDQAEIRFKSQISDGNIPFGNFAGIHVAESGQQSVLWLRNGDQVKGELALDEFKLLTRWGERSFQPSEVKSITCCRDVIEAPKFEADSNTAAKSHQSPPSATRPLEAKDK